MKRFKNLEAYAFSLSALFSATAQAQEPQSFMTLTPVGPVMLTLKECFKPDKIAAYLKAERNQDKTDLKGKFLLGYDATLYANIATGSYTIVGDIEDDKALNAMEPEDHDRHQKAGTLKDFRFSCIVQSVPSGYPSVLDHDQLYNRLFKPQ